MTGNDEPYIPPNHPLSIVIILFVIGLLIGFFIVMRNCCSKQLLSHHMHNKIARGGPKGRRKEKSKDTLPIYQQQANKQDYGSTNSTLLNYLKQRKYQLYTTTYAQK
jgi:hypothetical protein